jgi:hypothetical protein
MVGIIKEESRISLVRRFLKAFDLRLDELKFSTETLSGNFIHLTKGYSSALFVLSFGLEETSATLYKARNKQQALDLYGRLFQILEEIPISTLRFNISQHFSTEGDLSSYLKSLSPKAPNEFESLLAGRGVFYNLRLEDHNLTIFITLVNSLVVPNGLFLGVENQFSPYALDFSALSGTVAKHYAFVLKELGLEVKAEA